MSVELSVSAGGGTGINSSTIDDVPEAPAVEVSSERTFRVETLLQDLRLQAPPPSPPAVVVTYRATFNEVYMDAVGLTEETSFTNDDGALEIVQAQSEPFKWYESTNTSSDLAAADLGGLRVSLQRRNEAVLVQCLDTATASVSHWAAVPDDRSFSVELGWFEYLKSLGTPGGRLGKFSEEVLSIQTPFPAPTECELIARTIKRFITLAEPVPGTQIVSADQDMLELAGVKIGGSEAKDVSLLPAAVNRSLLERASSAFTTALRNGLEITEEWQGHGRATHQYRVFNGQALAPPLNDIGHREPDFGVCRDGHFYAAGSAALCGSCHSWSCRACDEIAGLASVTCAGCSTSVCRRCAAAAHDVLATSCLLCGDRACSDCGREPSVLGCELCGRDVCLSCRSDGHCPACAQLAPASIGRIAELPVELIGAGATVLIGSDKDATIVMLNRGGVYEQAIIRNGSVARWTVFGRSTIDHEYELRLAASQTAGTQVAPVRPAKPPESLSLDPHVIVHGEVSYFPAWSTPDGEIRGRATTPLARPESEIVRLVAQEFPKPRELPRPNFSTPQALQAVFRSMTHPAPMPLQTDWHRCGFEFAVTSKGLVRRYFEGSEEQRSFTAWTWTEGPAMPWISADWEPVPTVRAHAVSPAVEAAIVAIASLCALGVRTAQGTRWYKIRASEDALAATALARWMGLGDADVVNVFTDPNAIRLSHVGNATAVAVTTLPAGSLTVGVRSSPGNSELALAAWAPPAGTRRPELQRLPHPLRLSLEQSIGPVPSWTQLDIGAHIKQLSTMPDGHEWLYERTLAAGQTDARRINATSGYVLDAGVIDREGHFGVASSQCRYCGGITCAVCMSKTVACDCCGIDICRLCICEPHENLWLCPACKATRRPTRSEAREHGRLLSTRRMLVGSDVLHSVVFERSKHHWTRGDGDGGNHLLANPSVTEFLDERLTQHEK